MAKNLQLKYAILAYLCLFWCGVAYAADMTLEQGLKSISGFMILAILLLSVLGGAAGTLIRMSSPTAPIIRNLPLELAKDVVSSIFAGFLGFLFSSWYNWDSWIPHAIIISSAGFAGSKLLEIYLSEGIIPWVKALVVWAKEKITGKKEESSQS